MKNKVEICRYRDIVKRICDCQPEMMVEHFYQNIGKEMFLKREKIRNSIKTISQWEKERHNIRKNFQQAIGSNFPETKVSTIEKGELRKYGLTVKKIVFSLHKNHWVPALIYIPEEINVPACGMLLPAGHSINGKTSQNTLAVFYAINGYVVITYDFVGQGERALKDENGYIYAFASTAHNIVGVPMTLYGYNLNWFTIYETMAAVSVLQDTGLVDTSKIGITGASGGGTNSFYSAGFDERIAATAPAASVHSFKNYVYQDDCEQSFFNHIEMGLDYPDIASFLIAPRPMFIVANTHDIWDIEGTEYVYNTAKRFYEMHGAADKLRISISDKGHSYDIKEQTDVLKWFNEIFDNKHDFVPFNEITKKSFPSDKEIIVLPEKKERSFYLKNFLNVFTKNVQITKKDKSFIENIKNDLKKFAQKTFTFEIIDRYPIGDIDCCRMVFYPEKNLVLPAEILIPRMPRGTIILLDEIKRTEKQHWQFELANKKNIVIRPDLRGLGETALKDDWPDIENWCQNNFSGKNFKLFILCHLLGRYIVVERAKDILALVSIAAEQLKSKRITVHACGATALSAIFASIVDRRVQKLMLQDFLYSFRDVFEKHYPVWKADHYIQGILKAGYDVEDLCSMSHARIEWKNGLDGIMRPIKNGKSSN